MKILLGVSGSIAAMLTPKLVKALEDPGNQVATILTGGAKKILHKYGSTFLESASPVYDDASEWTLYDNHSKVLHVELAKWADRLVIAPATAATIAKLVHGISDNLLTCTFLAFPPKDGYSRVIVAPAMNTHMYTSLPVQNNLNALRARGVTIIEPQAKELYCGDSGIGAMANIDDIVSVVMKPQPHKVGYAPLTPVVILPDD